MGAGKKPYGIWQAKACHHFTHQQARLELKAFACEEQRQMGGEQHICEK
jgi:hypothetical protein